MFAAKNAKLVYRVQLQLIKSRNVSGPGVNHSLRKTKIHEAHDFRDSNRLATLRKSRAIDGARDQHRPAKLPIKSSAHRRILFAANLPCGIDHSPHDIVKQAQDTDAMPFPDFFGAPQRL